jgi:ATP-dependent Clp protease ATP-binding subunit ClpC
VIILTSNIGAQYIDKMEEIGFSMDKSKKAEYEDVKDKVMKALKDNFRPEFLNRLDDVIIFDILSEKAVSQIVDIQLEIVRKRLEEKEIKLVISKEVISYLAREGYNPQYGARPLKRLIQEKILNPVAGLMISRGVLAGGVVTVGFKNKEFTFEVKGKKK